MRFRPVAPRLPLLAVFAVAIGIGLAIGAMACEVQEDTPTPAPIPTFTPIPTATPIAVAADETPGTSSVSGCPTPVAATPIEREETLDVTEKLNRWSAPPEMQIDPSKCYSATFETDVGNFVIELTADKTPITVNSFVFLAREGYYDNTTFHRVIPDFMAQAGDPSGTGTGGPGYTIQDEFDQTLRHDGPGILSMANVGRPNTGGGQFFITFGPTPWLDNAHAVFGRVTEGMDVVQSIRIRDPQSDPNPGTSLHSVTITETDAN